MQRQDALHGRAALEAAGMPHELAAQVMLLANDFGVAIAVRAGHPSYLYEDLSVPKPLSIKAKTGNWGLTKGVIPRDPMFGNPANAEIEMDGHQLYSDHDDFVQHKVELNYVLRGLQKENPEFELVCIDGVMADDDIHARHRLMIRVLGMEHSPIQDTVFSIDLGNPLPESHVEVSHVRTQLTVANASKPLWWDDAFGVFEDRIHARYHLYYQHEMNDEAKPVEIYGKKVKGITLPITGDMDILWISRPNPEVAGWLNHVVSSLPIHEPVNVNDSDVANNLHATLIAIARKDPNHFIERKDIQIARLQTLGCLTPFEAYIILTLNKRFASIVKNIANLFQHGPENRNPGRPSSIDSPVLHIVKGDKWITATEEALISCLLDDEKKYISSYPFDVHPVWNLELWAPVIRCQLKLGQPVPDSTRDKYLEYTLESAPTELVSLAGTIIARKLSDSSNGTAKMISGGLDRAGRRLSATGFFNRPRSNSMSKESDPILSHRACSFLELKRTGSRSWHPDMSFLSKSNTHKLQQYCEEKTGDEVHLLLLASGIINAAILHKDGNRTGFVITYGNDNIEVSGNSFQPEIITILKEIVNLLDPTEKLEITGDQRAVELMTANLYPSRCNGKS